MPSVRRFSFFTGSGKEDAIADYVIREHHGGRALSEILADPHVTKALSKEQIERLLDRPELIQAVGDDLIAAQRAAMA